MLCFLLCKKQRCWTFSKGKCSAKQNVTNAFDALQKDIFASHFVTQNVTNAFWLCKNAFDALQKYIWCKNAFLRTFSFGKCSASHFVLLNILLCKMFSTNKMLQMHLMRCKNAFLRTFSKGKCSAVQKCICNILLHKMYASHFPKENVQLCKNAFDALQKYIWCKNAFLRTFYFVKCSASHFVGAEHFTL